MQRFDVRVSQTRKTTAARCAGRLNILGNVVRKPLSQIFKEFTGKPIYTGTKSAYGTGDVKYHLGTSYDRPTANGAPPSSAAMP